MIVNAGLLIDFGNSETRVIVISGNKNYRFNMANKFAELPPGYRVNSKYSNGKSTIFKANDTYFANGQIVDREFNNVCLRPSALQSKTEQIVTELTINLAFIKALTILAQAYNIPVNQLDVTFNVSALLPPLDHEVNEAKLESQIKAVTSVSTLMPQTVEASFKIEDVNIQSEAVAAFFGAFYQEEGVIHNPNNDGKSLSNGDTLVRDNGQHITLVEVENNKKFMQGYTLVLDIGAGTTDVALFQDMELVESSKDTFKSGGNTVQSIVGKEIRKVYGYAPNKLETIIETGLLPEGNDFHDVSDIVTSAKEQYSRVMMEDIRQYLERMTIPMPLVKGLLVAGGGSLASIRDGVVVSPAMSEVLMKYLKTLAPRLEALDTEGKDLRALNIEGLMVIHKYA